MDYSLAWKLETSCAVIKFIFNEYASFLLSAVTIVDLSMIYMLQWRNFD